VAESPTKNPKTPPFPPEQIAAVTLAGLGILGQVLPLDPEAKTGIVQLVTIIAPTVAVSGAAVRVGRQKWWKNFWRVDADHDSSTPDTLIPVPFLVVAGVAVVAAIGLTIALILVLFL
jgi:hypothetical protein